ncbi:D-alanyl-D-alanine carboxypeptidase [Streptomyces sp. NPDC048270]|uniref:D-alanyl-D-alanine carboxypeptidase family protein n=1 Tax=Streptomyces sp. NPDC048270 TaxID=3154615 RepID=UPI0033FF7519
MTARDLRRAGLWGRVVLPCLLAVVGMAAVQLTRPLPAPVLTATQALPLTFPGHLALPWPDQGQGAVEAPGLAPMGGFGNPRPVPIASVAKVMTAYAILRDHPLGAGEEGPRIAVDARAVEDGRAVDESRIPGLREGQEFGQRDMLKMLLLPSANNIARLLARWDTGTTTEDAFVARMNAAARDLGMYDTTYTDPSGLDADTVSTAADQLKLARAAMAAEAFREIVRLPAATVDGLPAPLVNSNGLLPSSLGVRGIKTGSSTPAGGALMWAAYVDVGGSEQPVLGVMLGQHASGPDVDAGDSLALALDRSRTLVEAARAALSERVVIAAGTAVGHLDDGLGTRTPVVAVEDLRLPGVAGQQLHMRLTGGPAGVTAARATAGTLTVSAGTVSRSVPVLLARERTRPSVLSRLLWG